MKYYHWIDPVDSNNAPRPFYHGQPDGTLQDFGYGPDKVKVSCRCRVSHTTDEYNEKFHQYASRNMAGVDVKTTKEERLEFQKYMDPHYTTEIKGKRK